MQKLLQYILYNAAKRFVNVSVMPHFGKFGHLAGFAASAVEQLGMTNDENGGAYHV